MSGLAQSNDKIQMRNSCNSKNAEESSIINLKYTVIPMQIAFTQQKNNNNKNNNQFNK